METTTGQPLTGFDIDRAMNDDRWLGHGYLGIRQHGSEFVAIDDADAIVLAIANEAGLDYEDLFLWLNSRDGRHTADAVFTGATRDELDRWGMGPRPSVIAALRMEVPR
jgi:hypothetical protein